MASISSKKQILSILRRLKKPAWMILRTYVVLCLILYFFQSSLLYFPTDSRYSKDADTETLAVDGANLIITVQPQVGKEALVYFGGNAEDVSIQMMAFSHIFRNRAIFLMHYRGYGGSSGDPSEEALHKDAQVLYDRIRRDHSDVIVVGRSLGTGVAIRIAAKAENEVVKLVLLTPYDSIANVAKSRFFFAPIDLMIKDRFDAYLDAPKVTAPTLIVAAGDDEIIPAERTRALFEAFSPNVASYIEVEGVGHERISVSAGYFQALRSLRSPPVAAAQGSSK